MSILHYKILGMKHGDFRPANQSKKALLDQIEEIKSHYLPARISTIYAPRIDFTNQSVEFLDKSEFWNPIFARSQATADGGIVRYDQKTAVAIFPGDCPTLCFQQGNTLAVMHIGYRCLIRQNPNEESIIETTIRKFDPKQVKVFMFGGIGVCCWLPENDKPEILKPETSRHPEILQRCLGKTNKNSPFGPGHISVDIYKLATELLKYVGVPENNISMDSTCTCCAKENGQPVFWSHTRFEAGKQGSIDGRNLSLAWLE